MFKSQATKFIVLISAVLMASLCSAAAASSSSADSSTKTTQRSTTSTSASHSHHSTTSASHKKSTKSAHSTKSGKSSKSKKTAGKHGQRKIDSERAREIQQALIHEHYLTGEPTGVWDDTSEKAMQKFQADNGWQDKTTPDSRALIKLGLGPDHQHLLNPETAMTTSHAQSVTPAASPGAGATASKTPQ